MLVILLSTAVILALIFSFKKYYNLLNFWNQRGVFCEKPHFIFGNLADFETSKSLSQIHKEFYTKYKNRYSYIGFFFYLKPAITIYDLDVAKNILVRDFSNFTSKFR